MTDIFHDSFFLQRTDSKSKIFTNYSDYDNERLTNTGLESLEKLK